MLASLQSAKRHAASCFKASLRCRSRCLHIPSKAYGMQLNGSSRQGRSQSKIQISFPAGHNVHHQCLRLVRPGLVPYQLGVQGNRRDWIATKSTANASEPLKAGTDSKILQFVSDQFLPLALILGMTLGYFYPSSGMRASELSLQTWTTTGIFIISGLGMRRGETVEALSSWGSFLFGMLSILVITPLAGFVALRLPLQPPELAVGLAVFCCMPTTLSSGVSLTQTVGGNTALALLLTVGSNLLGIFTMPFVLCAVLGSGQGAVHIAPEPLLKSLMLTILAPLLVGAAARAFIPGVAAKADGQKKQLGRLSAILLAMVPWMQISKAVADNITVPPSSLMAAVAAGLAFHTAFLAFNWTAVNALKLGTNAESRQGLQRAVVLVASQKTLPIAVAVLSQLAIFVKGPIGLAVIPCVVCHLGQILIDSMLISHWMNEDKKTKTPRPGAMRRSATTEQEELDIGEQPEDSHGGNNDHTKAGSSQ